MNVFNSSEELPIQPFLSLCQLHRVFGCRASAATRHTSSASFATVTMTIIMQTKMQMRV